MRVVSGTLALPVVALTLLPDKQPPIMAVLLMLLIEVHNTSLITPYGFIKMCLASKKAITDSVQILPCLHSAARGIADTAATM